MNDSPLTEAQAAVLAQLTDEPQRQQDIADASGRSRHSIHSLLMALRAKGLAHKSLNPSRWTRAT